MADPTGARARFDDFAAGTYRTFHGQGIELIARAPQQVAQVLDAVEAHARAGRWAFGFLSYEAAAGLDSQLPVHSPHSGDDLPLAWFAICDGPQDDSEPTAGVDPVGGHLDWKIQWSAEQHAEAIDLVHAHIADGETYQCNLTTRFTATLGASSVEEIYRNLAAGQRGAHNALIDTGQFVIASASPELFFCIESDRITMRPMKGTASRGRTTAEDTQAVSELRSSAKERAENVMIVDLVRNDLSRIAVAGSVTTPRLLHCEQYPTVHQLTSDVTAILQPGVSLTEIFRALFPCGSITGAPKAKTMAIIKALESGPRGVYCGAIGVVGPPANPSSPPQARFSVAIRTAVLDTSDGTLTYGVGGGITWDSRPQSEYAEVQAKARILSARPTQFHLIETLRYDGGAGVHALDDHLARAADSARYFNFQFDPVAIRRAITARPISIDTVIVRVLMFRDGRFILEVLPWERPPKRPVRLGIDLEPIDASECWRFHKTSLRRPFTTRMARHTDAEDVLLINQHGHITESCMANVAVMIEGRWLTPRLDSGCIPGIERARRIESGQLVESDIDLRDLASANQIALVSSVRGWRPAELVNIPSDAQVPISGGDHGVRPSDFAADSRRKAAQHPQRLDR